MTDQIPADKVREILDGWERIKEYADWDDLDVLVKDIRDLLPTPPLKTLADMTLEERAECKWMQADVPEVSPDQTCIITRISPGGATVLDPDGVAYRWFALDSVTPRPDLPRMEWPGEKKPDPAPALPDGWRLADHQKHGRGIVTNPVANQMGNVCFVGPFDDSRGHDWLFCRASELTYLDQEADQ